MNDSDGEALQGNEGGVIFMHHYIVQYVVT